MNPHKSLMSLFSILFFFCQLVWQGYLPKVTYKVELRLKSDLYKICVTGKLMVLTNMLYTCFPAIHVYCSNCYYFECVICGDLLIHHGKIRNQIIYCHQNMLFFFFHFVQYPYIFHFLTVLVILNTIIIKQCCLPQYSRHRREAYHLTCSPFCTLIHRF